MRLEIVQILRTDLRGQISGTGLLYSSRLSIDTTSSSQLRIGPDDEWCWFLHPEDHVGQRIIHGVG